MRMDATRLDLPETAPEDPTLLIDAIIIPSLQDCALLLDVDGTLLELASTPSEVRVPPDLRTTMDGLLQRTSGALALVSGRSINDLDTIFAPARFPAVGGHGAEMRLAPGGSVTPSKIQPIDPDL